MTEHTEIWLQPWCDGCAKHCSNGEGRLWCQDDVWEKCEECGQKSVRYVLAPPEPDDDGQPDEAQEWHDFDPDC
jgi:hypothetical protein